MATKNASALSARCTTLALILNCTATAVLADGPTEKTEPSPLMVASPRPLARSPSQGLLDSTAKEGSQQLAAKTRRVPLATFAEVGMGYASLQGEIRGRAVNSAAHRSVENAVNYEFKYIGSYNELAETLSVSASASFGGGFGSASASMSLFRSVNFSSTKVYVLVRMTVVTHVDTVNRFALDDGVRSRVLALKSEYEAAYGDGFIYSVTSGGELCALMEFETSSLSEHEAISADVSAKIGAFGGGVSMQQQISTVTSGKQVRVLYAQTGGNTGEPVVGVPAAGPLGLTTTGGVLVMTPDELIERIRRFPAEARAYSAQSKALYGDVVDYGVAENWPSEISRAPLDASIWAVEDLARTKRLIDENLNAARLISSTPSRFEATLQQWAYDYRDYLEFASLEVGRVGHLATRSSTVARRVYRDAVIENRARFSATRSGQPTSGSAPCPLAHPDLTVVKDCLFGPDPPFHVVTAAPTKVTFKQSRILVGEHETAVSTPPTDWFRPLFARCRGLSGMQLQEVADQFCGKSGPDDGVRVILGSGGGAIGGNYCGYQPWNVTCVTTK